jgi:hypothetical protein
MPSNFIIKKNAVNSELTNAAIIDLKTRINELNAVYNIIIKHVCIKKRLSTHDYLNKITNEVSSLYSDYLDRFCIVDKIGSTPTKCPKPMFEPTKLSSLAKSLYLNPFFNKACIFKHHITGDFEPNVQVAGSYEKLLDIKQILREKETYRYDDSNNLHNTTYVCFHKDAKLVCTEIYHNNNSQCVFCEKWSKDRNSFRRIIKELLGTIDHQVALYLMEQSVNLLPSVILTQKQYNDFFISLDKYKKSKQ